jgi:hypothetical protein
MILKKKNFNWKFYNWEDFSYYRPHTNVLRQWKVLENQLPPAPCYFPSAEQRVITAEATVPRHHSSLPLSPLPSSPSPLVYLLHSSQSNLSIYISSSMDLWVQSTATIKHSKQVGDGLHIRCDNLETLVLLLGSEFLNLSSCKSNFSANYFLWLENAEWTGK